MKCNQLIFFTLLALNNGALPSQAEPLYSLSEELQWLKAETVLYSASRHEENLFQCDSAAFVISQDDIKRSAATSIPELLRMVPGINVARINANQYAVSIRGFNGRYSEKLLVMIDGRSVYTINYSGVFWETIDLPLPDIERIEVIRGPGSSLWGSNAVNGVINIITKDSEETVGIMASGHIGSRENITTLRYGNQHENLSYRITGKGRRTEETKDGPRDDSWDQITTTYRLDYQPSSTTNYALFGGGYSTTINNDSWLIANPSTPPYFEAETDKAIHKGLDTSLQFKHQINATNEITAKSYITYSDKEMILFQEERTVFDLEIQNRFQWWQRNTTTWGLGYRLNRDKFINTTTASFTPTNHTIYKYNFFIQEETALVPKMVTFTLGCKIENSNF